MYMWGNPGRSVANAKLISHRYQKEGDAYMKNLLIPILTSSLLLSACTSPNYGEDKEIESEPISSTDVISMYGAVVAITDDNQLLIKVNKPEEIKSQGIQVNREGVVKVALAAVNTENLDSTEISALTTFLNSRILHDEVIVEIPNVAKLNEIEGYVSFTSDNDNLILLQDMLDNEFVHDLIDSEAVSQIEPHLASIQDKAKVEIINILNNLEPK